MVFVYLLKEIKLKCFKRVARTRQLKSLFTSSHLLSVDFSLNNAVYIQDIYILSVSSWFKRVHCKILKTALLTNFTRGIFQYLLINPRKQFCFEQQFHFLGYIKAGDIKMLLISKITMQLKKKVKRKVLQSFKILTSMSKSSHCLEVVCLL